MNIKYCLPIIEETQKQVLKALTTKDYNLYEIWLDYIKDLDDKFVTDIAKKFSGKIIFLFRRQDLEKIRLPMERRLNIISLLSKSNNFLDLDFLSQQEELDLFKIDSHLKLILSYHNYKETPKINYLKSLTDKMRRYNPDIIKVATFCNKEEDGLDLLHFLLQLKKQGLKYIVLGMGQKGLISRIFGPLWGNEITFAPQDLKTISAKGQLTKKTLELIFKELK